MRNKIILISLFGFCFWPALLLAQKNIVTPFQDTLNRKMLAAAIISESAFYAGGMSYLQFIWYKDHERVPFHFYNDNSGYLQVDKFGHSFGAYLESYIGYHWLRGAGVPKGKALLYGGTLGFILQAPIEVFDGLYEGWGFSWGDIMANTAGAGLLIGQELLFDRQFFQYKFSLSPSGYAPLANGYLGDNLWQYLFYDYNSHTYWLSTNLNNFILKDKIPDWMNIALGYSANGMIGEFENRKWYRGAEIPETERYRQFILSLDIDWAGIPTRSSFLKGLFRAMAFIKLPFPALEYNTLGNFKAYGLYY